MFLNQQEQPVLASVTGLEQVQGRNGFYHFGARVSQGKFGVVESWWIVNEGLVTSRPIAIKFLPIGHRACKYPIREVLWLSRLGHPHIIKFHELLLTPKHIGIVMEYLSRGSFRSLLNAQKGSRMSENKARWYFQQLVVILDFCHRVHGISHRDIKPENLLVSDKGYLKLADFGMSKHVSFDSAMKTQLGTRTYSAPEVCMGVTNYDARLADIWSCGIFLHEMIYGCHFYSKSKPQIMVSPELDHLLHWLLKEDPSQRITLEGLKAHSWVTESMQLGVFERNDQYKAFPRNAQTEEELCGILEKAFPKKQVGRAQSAAQSESSSMSNYLRRIFGGQSSSKRSRISH